jgi:hypothetical protein
MAGHGKLQAMVSPEQISVSAIPLRMHIGIPMMMLTTPPMMPEAHMPQPYPKLPPYPPQPHGSTGQVAHLPSQYPVATAQARQLWDVAALACRQQTDSKPATTKQTNIFFILSVLPLKVLDMLT